MRAVSLLPSATEILSTLGVEPVGISHSCDYPPPVTDRPRVTRTVIDHEGRSSNEIDDQMQSVDGAVYDIDADRLEALDPDVVVTQATCDVCAVESSAVFETVAARDIDATVLTLDPHSFDEVLADVRRVGDVVGRAVEAEEFLEEARDRIETVRSRVADTDHPRTAVLDWTAPPMKGGHWIRDLIDLAGGDASFQPDGPSEPIRWADLRVYDPERLVIAPCGFETERAVEAVTELTAQPGWADLSAVRSGHVFAVDGNALFNRPGPRLVDSLERLSDCLHPDRADAVEGERVCRVEGQVETIPS
ncbi:MAG: ABC transporter substrate-binding protein [Halobellus sp.]|uniref:ABC transporter substrate-binding protein n=1 Tax=Halobellus sp. TaxID=1979212 RepID=UPI0035D4C40A